jgi:hypothetical protein
MQTLITYELPAIVSYTNIYLQVCEYTTTTTLCLYRLTDGAGYGQN